MRRTIIAAAACSAPGLLAVWLGHEFGAGFVAGSLAIGAACGAFLFCLLLAAAWMEWRQ